MLSRYSPTQLAHALGGMLVTLGAVHFAAPEPFDSIIPAEIPADPRVLTLVSGAAEIALGAGLLIPATRKPAAAGTVALLVAVYPANINMVRLWWGKSTAHKTIAIGRLPLQFPMIAAALRVYRNS